MAYKYNPLLKVGLDDTGNDAAAAAAGSDTQIQYNNSGALGASAGLTWDDIAKELGVGGDINLDDGGTFATTLQLITPTANRTISFPDATGTVALVAGSSGQLIYNNAGANAGTPTLTYDGSILTSSGRFINSYNATASSPAKTFTGTWFTGGTATTTKPHVLIEPSDTTSTAWSTSGTGLGINAATGFTGRLIDLQVNGTSNFAVDSTGRVSFPLGTAALPSLYPGTDTNTGIWSPAADTLAWSTGGSERARIDSAGRVGIGTSPSKTLDVAGDAKIVTTSATQNILLGVSSGGIGYKTQVDFGHPTVGARIESERLGANTQSSLSLWTTSPAGVITRALTIDQEQYVRLASGTGGIQFNGDTAAANALDDYEEGTFTPAIIGKTVAGTGTYSVNTGSYTKIGNRVLFNLRIIWTAHTGTGNMEVSGLPFTVAGSVSLSIRHTDLTSPAGTIVQVYAPNATQVVRLDSVATGGGASTPLAIDTAGDIMISGVYVV